MIDKTITKEITNKGAKPLLLVFGMVIFSFIVIVVVNSFNNYGGFSYLRYPVLVHRMIGESLSGLIAAPLIHIMIASIWKSKRNKRTRRNIFFGWALALAIIYAFGGTAQIKHLYGEKVITDSASVKQSSREYPGNVREAAVQGDAEAQFNLGVSYDNGKGVPKDYQQAVSWYRKAAEQGHAKAQFNLGMSYANGQGVPKDDQQAIAWLRKSAEQGDVNAQFNLGVIYGNGLGVPKDDQQAIAWYRKAAEQGNAEAQFYLGVSYVSGQGKAQDYQRAATWFRKSAEQGDAKAQYMLGSSYAYGVGVPRDQQQAYAWYSVAVANGYNDAVTKRDEIAHTLTRNQLNEAQELATHYFEQYQPQ